MTILNDEKTEIKFKELKSEVKVGILTFLKKEELNTISFTFKEITKKYLSDNNIDSNSIFLLGNLTTIGQILNISPEKVITIIGFGQELSISIDYLEDVSLYKK